MEGMIVAFCTLCALGGILAYRDHKGNKLSNAKIAAQNETIDLQGQDMLRLSGTVKIYETSVSKMVDQLKVNKLVMEAMIERVDKLDGTLGSEQRLKDVVHSYLSAFKIDNQEFGLRCEKIERDVTGTKKVTNRLTSNQSYLKGRIESLEKPTEFIILDPNDPRAIKAQRDFKMVRLKQKLDEFDKEPK